MSALKRCFTCGTDYADYDCPRCFAKAEREKVLLEIERLEKESRRRREESSGRERPDQDDPARQQSIEHAPPPEQLVWETQQETIKRREDISNSWRLQAEAKRQTGLRLEQAGMLDDAERIYLLCRMEDPSNVWVYENLAELYFRRAKHAQAASIVAKWISLLPHSDAAGDSYCYIALTYAVQRLRHALEASFLAMMHQQAASIAGWASPDALRFLAHLTCCGYFDLARSIASELTRQQPSVLHQVASFVLDPDPAHAANSALALELESADAVARKRIVPEIRTACRTLDQLGFRFTPGALLAVDALVCTYYQRMQEAILVALSLEALKTAEAERGLSVIAWAWASLAFLEAAAAWVLCTANNRTLLASRPAWAIALAIALSGATLLGIVLRRSQVRERCSEELARLRAEEQQWWISQGFSRPHVTSAEVAG